MLIETLIIGVIASVIGGVIVGVSGWFFAIRRAHETHARQIKHLNSVLKALAESIPDDQAAKAFRAIMRDENQE